MANSDDINKMCKSIVCEARTQRHSVKEEANVRAQHKHHRAENQTFNFIDDINDMCHINIYLCIHVSALVFACLKHLLTECCRERERERYKYFI